FALKTDRQNKLKISKNQEISCYYNKKDIVKFNNIRHVKSGLAHNSKNTKFIVHTLEPELYPIFQELRNKVEVF
uniref:Uncharacterized protein n=1 Tax=Callithrix jacchus TaxID=9483 RepID=A0A5F4W7G3_CALJA